MEHRKEVRIDRKTWLKGESTCLLDDAGCACILGQVYLARGIQSKVIRNTVSPSSLPQREWFKLPERLCPWSAYTGPGVMSFTSGPAAHWAFNLTDQVVSINDAPAEALAPMLRELLAYVHRTTEDRASETLLRWEKLRAKGLEGEELREAWLTSELGTAGIDLIFEG